MKPLHEQIGSLIEHAGITKFLASVCYACVEREHHARAHGDLKDAQIWAFVSAQVGAVCERILAIKERDDT